MSRVSNALNMYFYLSVKKKATIKELANKLEVSEKMIKKYKLDLELAGIYVGAIRGRNGCYYLETTKSINEIGLSEADIIALKMVKETITSGHFHYSNSFENLANKLLEVNKSKHIVYHNKMLIESDEVIDKEKELWKIINESVIDKNKLFIKYKSLKKDRVSINERVIHPYGLFDYKGASYVYGFCEKANDIRFFKLSRFEEYRKFEETFKVNQDFDFQNIMETSFGIYNDESKKVVLKIFYPMSEIIREKEITKNQIINQIDDKTILFSAEMKGYEEYKTWILGMGSCVEVIEPEELKLDILNEINKTIKLYNERKE